MPPASSFSSSDSFQVFWATVFYLVVACPFMLKHSFPISINFRRDALAGIGMIGVVAALFYWRIQVTGKLQSDMSPAFIVLIVLWPALGLITSFAELFAGKTEVNNPKATSFRTYLPVALVAIGFHIFMIYRFLSHPSTQMARSLFDSKDMDILTKLLAGISLIPLPLVPFFLARTLQKPQLSLIGQFAVLIVYGMTIGCYGYLTYKLGFKFAHCSL